MQKVKFNIVINPVFILIVAIVVVLIFWASWFLFGVYFIQDYINHHALELLNSQSSPSSTSVDTLFARLGQSGDAFGSFNALVSALACAGVFFAAYLQHETLMETRSGLKDQEKTQAKARFETTFFSLTTALNSSLVYICESKIRSQYEGTPNYAASIVDDLKGDLIGGDFIRLPNTPYESLVEAKKKLLKHNPFLNQYFRSLYQILKFIATNSPNSNLGGEFTLEKLRETTASSEEKSYANLIRSFVPENVYYLLAINCYARDDKDQYMSYRLLIERYAFLEHMPMAISSHHNTALIKELSDYYDVAVWGKSEDIVEFRSA